MARQRPGDDEELPKVPLTRETLREAYGLLRYLWPYRVKFAGALLALLLGSVCWLAFPFLVGTLIDSALPRLRPPPPAGAWANWPAVSRATWPASRTPWSRPSRSCCASPPSSSAGSPSSP